MAFVKVSVYRGTAEISEYLHMADRHHAVIAGGYPRYCCSPREEPVKAGDVDFFPKTDQDQVGLCAELEKIGFVKKHENHVSITYGYEGADLHWKLKPVPQVIKPVREGKIVTWGTVEEILENFDFTVVRVALVKVETCANCLCGIEAHTADDTTGKETCLCERCPAWKDGAVAWGGLADADFEADEKNTHIQIKNIHCPISSTLRCMKYARKGYFAGPAQVLKLFLDWERRGPEYRDRMIELFRTSQMGQITQKEIDELEQLLNVD